MADARTEVLAAMSTYAQANSAGDLFCDHAGLLDAIPTAALVRLVIDRGGLDPKVEWCRKCRDELPYGALSVRAEFIPWGRLFNRDDLVGPCCLKHLPKSVDLGRIDQWAITDLRPLHRIAGEPTSNG